MVGAVAALAATLVIGAVLWRRRARTRFSRKAKRLHSLGPGALEPLMEGLMDSEMDQKDNRSSDQILTEYDLMLDEFMATHGGDDTTAVDAEIAALEEAVAEEELEQLFENTERTVDLNDI